MVERATYIPESLRRNIYSDARKELSRRLTGLVPQGVLNRAVYLGHIPDYGPGKHSIPRALFERARTVQQKIISPADDKEARENWNRSNRRR